MICIICLWIDVTPCLPRWVVIFSPGFLGFDLPGLLPYCFMIPVKFRHELPLGSLVIQGMFLHHHIPSCLQSIPFNWLVPFRLVHNHTCYHSQKRKKSQKNNHFGQKKFIQSDILLPPRLLQSDILCLQLADNHRKLINSFYPFQGLGFLGFKASSFTHRASSPENGFHRRTRRQHFQ